ncbi:MAG: nitroreductase family protein [Anaerolineales bacterium]|nr:nitroreductase family protein [Anaerolineales bacterium]
MTIINTILSRRSIRKYTEEKVSEEMILDLLRVAMAAPTAMNNQPWEFVVVRDEVTLGKIRRKMRFARYDTPLAIIVCGNKKRSRNRAAWMFWEQDCSAAIENILIAAAGIGLGAVWIGIHPVSIFVNNMSKILDLPKEVTPLGMIYVGHPAEERLARTQYEEDRVHWDKW